MAENQYYRPPRGASGSPSEAPDVLLLLRKDSVQLNYTVFATTLEGLAWGGIQKSIHALFDLHNGHLPQVASLPDLFYKLY